MGTWAQLLLILGLIAVNAVLAGSEMALVQLRAGQVERLATHGARGRALARLTAHPNRYLATIQLGITLAGFLASATAAVTLARPIVARLSVLGTAAEPVAIVLVTSVLTLLSLVLGELAPKRLALQSPQRWALRAAAPLAALARLARPALWVLGHATDLVVRLLGGDPAGDRPEATPEEVTDLVRSGSAFSREERRVITGAVEATTRRIGQLLQPRSNVVALRAETPVEAGIRRLLDSGHTRAPVFTDRLDDAHRVVSLIDLVHADGDVGAHAHEAVLLPESLGLIDALRHLQRAREQMALVVSEYGGVEGLVTVEDLVEEFVGEIHDEYDRDVLEVVHHPDGSVTLPGHFPVHDLVDVGLSAPAGPYVTVAGLLIEVLGDLPSVGSAIDVDGWHYEVTDVADHQVVAIHVRPS